MVGTWSDFTTCSRVASTKGKEQAGRRRDRYGQPHFDSRLSGVIWLHSVSIGETIAAISLAKALAQTQPEAQFLITTNTVSAAELVDRETATGYLYSTPFSRWIIPYLWTAFWLGLNPASPFLWNRDFWPNLVSRTAAKSVPVIFASSQLSTVAFQRWIRNHHWQSLFLQHHNLCLLLTLHKHANFINLAHPPTALPFLDHSSLAIF